HGGTRRKAAELTDAEIMVFMTQEALPADRDLIRNLTAPLKEPETAAAYARQLPNASCSFVERYTRSVNYPDKSSVKSREDLPVYGIKTFFCSKLCTAYRKAGYESLGGYTEHTILNKDVIYDSEVIK